MCYYKSSRRVLRKNKSTLIALFLFSEISHNYHVYICLHEFNEVPNRDEQDDGIIWMGT